MAAAPVLSRRDVLEQHTSLLHSDRSSTLGTRVGTKERDMSKPEGAEKLPKYVRFDANGVLQFRRRIPVRYRPCLREIYGRTSANWVEGLGGKTVAAVRVEYEKVKREADAAFAAAEAASTDPTALFRAIEDWMRAEVAHDQWRQFNITPPPVPDRYPHAGAWIRWRAKVAYVESAVKRPGGHRDIPWFDAKLLEVLHARGCRIASTHPAMDQLRAAFQASLCAVFESSDPRFIDDWRDRGVQDENCAWSLSPFQPMTSATCNP
jgi:hypothetical protein